MLVKGIIIEQLSQVINNEYVLLNRYSVRIPDFESQNSSDKIILNCGLIFQPGNNLGYEPNDVVIIGFEHDDLNSGFILGKLYTNDTSNEQVSESNPFNLAVKNRAELPADTTIDNVNIIDEIRNMKNDINSIFNSLKNANIDLIN